MAEGVIPERPAARPRAAPQARTDDLRRGLSEAFAGEVGTRLPALRRALTAVQAGGSPLAVGEFVRHAHTLASSAAVLGEHIAAQHARSCELLLLPHLDLGQPPSPDVRAAADQLATLEVLLAPWLTCTSSDD